METDTNNTAVETPDGEASESSSPSIETRAREMGWVPKEEFRGDPENFIPAEDFVSRGEQMLPFLKAQNRKTSQELQSTRRELQQTRQLLQAATESIDELKNFNSQIARDRAKSRRSEIAQAIKEARDAGDVDKELELSDELSELNTAIREAEPAQKRKDKPPASSSTDHSQNPEFREWQESHPWFGTDRRRTSVAMGIANELRESEPDLKGRPFLDRVAEETELTLGGNPKRNGSSRVEGTRGGATGSVEEPRGQSYADLPQDAKAACERQAKRLVGEGRAFKDLQSWRKHYTKQYFNS